MRPSIPDVLVLADALAAAVAAHSDARMEAHAVVPGRSDEEWRRLKRDELHAWWQTRKIASAYRIMRKEMDDACLDS